MTEQAMLAPGDRLPDLELPGEPGRPPVRLLSPDRLAPVVLTLHHRCGPCAEYLAALDSEQADMKVWDGDPVVITCDAGPRPAVAPPGGLRVASSDAARLRSAGIPVPGVLVADQWGELHLVQDAGAAHRFPAPAEVIEWLRYLAIQCPECEGEAL